MSSNHDIAISVRGLGKSYTITHNAEKHSTLAETILHRLKRPLTRPSRETFWALRDVSFDVSRGEVMGIIGRNGAGKSTLLKILSRITEPSSGEVELQGRVGSLLEVGTGFHPELTGRENIYLNGAILGMRRAEIRKQFDAIVDFAGVERFLDTPVKRYSSGMYVRLAFAVAAHLQSEIVLVDEVLAVGDAEFQRKCVGKMKDIASSGRTVLFVSHNMSAVRALCTSGVLLDAGQVRAKGNLDAVVAEYSSQTGQDERSSWTRSPTAAARSPLSIDEVSCRLIGAQPEHLLDVSIVTRSTARHPPAFVAIDVLDVTGQVLMQAVPSVEGFINGDDGQNERETTVRVTLPPLIPGRYDLTVWAGPHNTETYDLAESCVSFDVIQSPTEGRTFPHTPDHGRIVPQSHLVSKRSGAPVSAGKAAGGSRHE